MSNVFDAVPLGEMKYLPFLVASVFHQMCSKFIPEPLTGIQRIAYGVVASPAVITAVVRVLFVFDITDASCPTPSPPVILRRLPAHWFVTQFLRPVSVNVEVVEAVRSPQVSNIS